MYSLQDHAAKAAAKLLSDHPVIPSFAEHLSIVLVGSAGAGFADEFSDIDLWVICADEVIEKVEAGFRKAGLRFGEGWPESVRCDGVQAHYFVFPISKLQYGLDIRDDYTLFVVKHAEALHDPSRQFAGLAAQYTQMPEGIVRSKIEEAYSHVTQYAFSMKKDFRRLQPLRWVEDTHEMASWALRLCCWLDGEPPVHSNWLFRQAIPCSTASIIVPAVSELLRSLGASIELGLSEAAGERPIEAAADALDMAAKEAIEKAGFEDIPRWSPPA